MSPNLRTAPKAPRPKGQKIDSKKFLIYVLFHFKENGVSLNVIIFLANLVWPLIKNSKDITQHQSKDI